MTKMPVIDLNFSIKSDYTPVLLLAQEDMSNEYRPTRFLSSDRPFAALHISKMRQSLPDGSIDTDDRQGLYCVG